MRIQLKQYFRRAKLNIDKIRLKRTCVGINLISETHKPRLKIIFRKLL